MHSRAVASLEMCGHRRCGQKKKSCNLENCMKNLRLLMVSVTTSLVTSLNTWFVIFLHWLFWQPGYFLTKLFSSFPVFSKHFCMSVHALTCFLYSLLYIFLTWPLYLSLVLLIGSLFHIFFCLVLSKASSCHLFMSCIHNSFCFAHSVLSHA